MRWATALLSALLASLVASGCATRPFDLQGHRGARGLAPENTLTGFTRALEIGVATLELDIGVTRDGVVVVHHDTHLNPDLARNSSGAWLAAPTPRLRDLTWAELSEFNVGRIRPGTGYAARHPDQAARDGEPIPRLADLFALVAKRGDTSTRFNIETKLDPSRQDDTIAPEAMVGALLGVIADHKMEARVTIQSFDWRTLKLVQARAPQIPTVYLSAQRSNFNTIARAGLWTAGMLPENFASLPAMVQAAGGAVWSPHFEDLTPALLRDAQARGLKVVPWTVNRRDDIGRLIDMGVDGLITDRPDLGAAALKERGRPTR
jgi:glycerophosphoryl diester phosphodiesterase